jgi:hypothetical protein
MKLQAGIQRVRAVLILFMLLLAACGAQSPGRASGDDSSSDAPVEQPNQPGGLDTSVSGEPGARGGPAQGNVVTGHVTDATGKPIAGAIIVPQSTDSPPQAVPEIGVFTDEQGRYQWHLPPGHYTLTIRSDGYAAQTKPITVVQGQPATLDVTLQP